MLWSKFDLLLERHKYPLPLAPTNVGSYGGENCCPVATRFMGSLLYRCFRRISIYALVQPSSRAPFLRSIVSNPVLSPSMSLDSCCQLNSSWLFRNLSYGSVNLVISQGNPKFETHKVDPPKREKWKTKKRLKLQRKREKQKRKAGNKRDPRWLGVKGKKKQKFANPEDRIKCKLEKAKVKEALLIERLKRYEISKLQVALPKPDDLTGEERFYLKKMAQKGSNYVPVGRRGIFGGVILNMHMHWKKHETVKVICKPCKPGQLQEYAREISRLSGGTAIQTFGDNTIIFYRGKNYVQPEVMSPVDTLSKKRALEKSKYEQSLESVRRFIAIAEKELELYYRHVALYGDPNNRNPLSVLDESRRETMKSLENPEIEETLTSTSDIHCSLLSDMKLGFTDQDLSETEDDSANGGLSTSELDCDTNSLSGHDLDTDDEEECEPDTKSSSQSYHNLHLDDGCKFDSELNDWSGPDEELELTSFCNQRRSVTAEDFTTLTQHRNLSR